MKYKWYGKGKIYAETYDMERTKVFNMIPEYFDEYITYQKHHEGNLYLCKTNVRSLDSPLGTLRSVGGSVDLSKSNITSLGELESVGGNLCLDGNDSIKSLGNLKHVGGNLFIFGLNITTLGNLEHVGGVINLGRTNLTSLGKLDQVGRGIGCSSNSSTHKLLMDSKFKDQVVSR